MKIRLSPRPAIASVGESAMGESLGETRLEFLLKTTVSHSIPGVVGNSLHEFGQCALKLKNV